MAKQEGGYVFLLWHSRPLDKLPGSPNTDDKLIGVFSSKAAAEAARKTASGHPGFQDWPDAFEISRYELDRLEWTEGFINWEEASRPLS